MKWAGDVGCRWEMRNAYGVLIQTPEGKKPLGRPRNRWQNNIKMDIKEIECEDMELIHLS
jgi:hypothetical protein